MLIPFGVQDDSVSLGTYSPLLGTVAGTVGRRQGPKDRDAWPRGLDWILWGQRCLRRVLSRNCSGGGVKPVSGKQKQVPPRAARVDSGLGTSLLQ